MASEPQAQALGEIIAWLEKQVRETREEQARNTAQMDQFRRQIHELADQVSGAERSVREIDPKLVPFKGVPEKIREAEEGAEHIRQSVSSLRADVDNSHRLLRAEAEYDRQERGEVLKRLDVATSQLGLVLSDVAQVQAQTGQLGQSVQALIERQREVEDRVHQFGLRLDRSIEVNRDMEARLHDVLMASLDEKLDVAFERLQVVGEMVKRNEDVISTISAERSLREEVLQEIGVWRQEHGRIDTRLDALEVSAEKLLGQFDKLHGDITLLEGRHSGLGERVAGMRRDIAEVVDHVREEFTKYNQMLEKQRRKQIQGLEQELRELKFHAFRPPEEP